jgi:hypothetical protein
MDPLLLVLPCKSINTACEVRVTYIQTKYLKFIRKYVYTARRSSVMWGEGWSAFGGVYLVEALYCRPEDSGFYSR